MSHGFYKVLHILGVLMMMAGLAGMAVHASTGAPREQNRLHGALGALHGLGLVLAVVAGFGMVAKLGLGLPAWVWLKVVLWLVFGALAALPYRKPSWNPALLWLLPILGAIGAWLGFYKPIF